MWCIKGIIKWGVGYGDEEHVIATFDNEYDAQMYIESAKLKQPTYRNKFKRRSLLGGCDAAWVEDYEPENYPHNPPVTF